MSEEISTAQFAKTCQFRTADGKPCRRRIAEGETRCWQHAAGLRQKIKSLARSKPLLFALSVVGVLGTLVFGFLEIYWHYQRSPIVGVKVPNGLACRVAAVNFSPLYRFFQDPPVYYQRLDTALRLGLTNHLGKPTYLRGYSAAALIGTDWVQFRNADSAAFEPFAFGVIAPGDPGTTAPYVGRFDLSANGFDYVMRQRPLSPDEHIELWMFFISGLSMESLSGISQFKFVFDDGAGEHFTCNSQYSVTDDKGTVVGTRTGDLKVMSSQPVPPNMREEPLH